MRDARYHGQGAVPALRGAARGLLPLLLALALAACGTAGPPRDRQPLLYHTVEKGDTLYSIAWHYGYDYHEVAAWNDIDPPYRIYPGQRLQIVNPSRYPKDPEPPSRRLPPEETRTAEKPAAGTTPPAKPDKTATRPATRKPAAEPAPAKEKRKTARKPARKAASGPVRWRWPSDGRVVQRFSPRKGKKGVDIRGRAGQRVVAAAAGEVVYSGDGLIGYGNLVIIKHNATYLSAYGHNRKLLVEEGEKVKPGQRIAEMGQDSKNVSILHFEIRRNGKPVDPLRYLPKK